MKTKFYLLGLAMILSLSTITANATSLETKEAIKAKVTMMSAEQKEARVNTIKMRIEEIKTMDMSSLSHTEKKALREELKTMKYEAKEMSGGVYLSVGAIIIIILLLILIL